MTEAEFEVLAQGALSRGTGSPAQDYLSPLVAHARECREALRRVPGEHTEHCAWGTDTNGRPKEDWGSARPCSCHVAEIRRLLGEP